MGEADLGDDDGDKINKGDLVGTGEIKFDVGEIEFDFGGTDLIFVGEIVFEF